MNDPSLEHIELLNDELADLERQVLDGDIDGRTAAMLRNRYTAELESLIAARGADNPPTGTPEAQSWMSRRAVVGMAIVGAAVAAIAVFAILSLNDGSVSGVEGVAGDVLGGEGPRDLSTVTNEELEAVIAANPDVVPMRLALARRYFEAGEFDKALDHYFEVLNREQHPEALANVAWMTYLSGHADVAVGYAEAAIERDPTFLTARWFLGNIYATLGRNDEAVVMLRSVVDDDGTPDEVRESALELIRQLAGS